MKKIILTLLFLLPFILPVQTRAQTATVSSAVSKATPSGILNPNVTQAINLFMARLKAAVSRADNISGRISSGLARFIASGQISTDSAGMVKLNTQQKTLINQLGKLKSDLAQLNLQSQSFMMSPTPLKDYLQFKNQALTLTKNLKDVYRVESDLVTGIKQLKLETATPSVQPILKVQ